MIPAVHGYCTTIMQDAALYRMRITATCDREATHRATGLCRKRSGGGLAPAMRKLAVHVTQRNFASCHIVPPVRAVRGTNRGHDVVKELMR